MAAQTDTPEHTTLHDLIAKRGQNVQFLLLGDMDHDDSRVSAQALNIDTLMAIKKAGFPTLMIEYPISSQNIIDAYTQDRITRDQFKDLLKAGFKPTGEMDPEIEANNMADLVENARAVGLKLWSIDGDEGNYDAPLDNEERRRINEILIEQASASPDMRIPKSFYHQTREDVQVVMKEDGSFDMLRYNAQPRGQRSLYATHVDFPGRMDLDSMTLGQRIYTLANSEPAAVFYGGWHYAKVNDVDETLERLAANDPSSRPQATQVINIFDRSDGKAVKTFENFCDRFNCAAQPNHINYFFEPQTIDMGNKGYKPVQEAAHRIEF